MHFIYISIAMRSGLKRRCRAVIDPRPRSDSTPIIYLPLDDLKKKKKHFMWQPLQLFLRWTKHFQMISLAGRSQCSSRAVFRCLINTSHLLLPLGVFRCKKRRGGPALFSLMLVQTAPVENVYLNRISTSISVVFRLHLRLCFQTGLGPAVTLRDVFWLSLHRTFCFLWFISFCFWACKCI